MSNGNDPDAVLGALERAEDAFEVAGRGRPTWEEGIDTDSDWNTQLTKACKLLSAIDTLDEEGESYTSIIELGFGTIERSIEAYTLSVSEDDLEDFRDHTFAYERARDLGLFDQGTVDRLTALYSANRTESYYGGRRPTEKQAAAMCDVAASIHEYVNDQLQNSGVCIC